jgi:NAD+ kinase
MTDHAQSLQAVPPLRAILLGAGRRPNVLPEAERLRPIIERHARIVAEDFTGTADMSELEADLAIVLGGDGAILRAAHQMGHRQLPVVAVNLGRLGFLADLTPAELPEVLRDFAAGKLRRLDHLMIECSVLRAGSDSTPGDEGEEICRHLGLNELVVWSGPTFSMMEMDLYIDAELVTTYSCDGLILSTPVGSTAHSLSAGGPILRKELQAVVICPISPHTLTNRPVVDSAERVYEMVVSRPNVGTSVVLDGRVICTLQPGDRVRVTRAEPRFQLVAAPGHSYFRTLREKLGWGGRLQLNNRDQ